MHHIYRRQNSTAPLNLITEAAAIIPAIQTLSRTWRLSLHRKEKNCSVHCHPSPHACHSEKHIEKVSQACLRDKASSKFRNLVSGDDMPRNISIRVIVLGWRCETLPEVSASSDDCVCYEVRWRLDLNSAASVEEGLKNPLRAAAGTHSPPTSTGFDWGAKPFNVKSPKQPGKA
jgi:hypothetical protein